MTNFLQREFKSKPQVRGQFPERPDERGADDHDRGSAYISPWERLSAATERVMGATGRSRDEVRTDICRAIADGAVKIQGKLGRHTTRPCIFNMVLVGEDFHIPPEIKPEHLDWEQSRPVTAWYLRRERSRVPGYWELEWIELFRSDVTNALCAVRKRTDTAQDASSGTSAMLETRVAVGPGLRSRAGPQNPCAAGSGRRRGAQPKKFEQARDAMRNDIQQGRCTLTGLRDMLEKNLSATYGGVSRDTARKARRAVLSEFGVT